MTSHLDLDGLADVLAGQPEPAHLAGCPACRAALADVQRATEVVRRQLGDLPALPAPAGLAGRPASPADAGRPVSTVPAQLAGRRRRPFAIAAAAALVLGGAAVGLAGLIRQPGGPTTASRDAAPPAAAPAPGAGLVRNTSGHDYAGRAALAAALPGLLGGAAEAGSQAATGAGGADALARLRTTSGLAECLLALLPPRDPRVRPLAVDYARYRGSPALVVVLSTTRPAKLDVFVVGPACSRADDSTLLYASLDRP